MEMIGVRFHGRGGQGSVTAARILYSLWNDPYCLHSLHEERPDLVKKYTRFLQVKWKEHQELAKRFTRSEQTNLTPEQLRTLRSLGYIK